MWKLEIDGRSEKVRKTVFKASARIQFLPACRYRSAFYTTLKEVLWDAVCNVPFLLSTVAMVEMKVKKSF